MRRKSLDIGVDMDGVLYDFVGTFRSHVRHATGRSARSLPEPTVWNFSSDWGMSHDEFNEHFRNSVVNGDMFRVGASLPGAVRGMQALAREGHRLHIVTDRAGFTGVAEAEDRTRSWLADHRIPYDTLTISADKTIVPVDAFIDDRPENIEAVTAAGIDAYVMHYTYNASLPNRRGRRVTSMMEFAARVSRLTKPALIPA